MRPRAGWLVLSVVLAACGSPIEEWTPVTESSSYEVLTDQLRDLESGLERLERELPAGARREAEEGLREIREPLFRLQSYYLPVLQARDRCFKAYRAWRAGRAGEARKLLAESKGDLTRVAKLDDPGVRQRMLDLISRIDGIDEDLEVAPDRTGPAFEALLADVDMAFLRGDLVLSPGRAEE